MNQRHTPGLALYLILGAFAAFTTAIVIHNRFGLDPAIAPATLFVGLLLWRRRRAFLLAAALVIALPAFLFLKPAVLLDPEDLLPFSNHAALLLAGLLAVASAVVTLLPASRTASPLGS
jgi:hypothetical protein